MKIEKIRETAQQLFSRRLAQTRMSNGVTQRDLGALVGVSQSAISDMERGARYPSVEILICLSSELGVDATWLAGHDEMSIVRLSAARQEQLEKGGA